MSFVERLGTRFWPPGPATVNWTLDLAARDFGPLRLRSPLEEVKRRLGPPSNRTWFSVPDCLRYDSMNLIIEFEEQKIAEVRISWEDMRDDPGFDPPVRFGEGSYASARTATEEMITRAFGQPTSLDREAAGMIQWKSGDDTVFVELSDEGRIVGIGFMI